MLKRTMVALCVAFGGCLEPALAVQVFVPPGGMGLPTTAVTEYARAPWVVESEAEGRFLLCSARVTNLRSTPVQVTMQLRVVRLGSPDVVVVSPQGFTTLLPGSQTQTFQVPYSLAGMELGAHRLECAIGATSPNALVVQAASYAGSWAGAGAPNLIVSINGETGAAQTFGWISSAECPDGAALVSASNAHLLCVPYILPSDDAEGEVCLVVEGGCDGDHAVGVGYQALAGGPSAIAIGHGAEATSQDSIAIGHNADGGLELSVAIGAGARGGGSFEAPGIALGPLALAQGQKSIAIGFDIPLNAANTIAIGGGNGNALPNAAGAVAVGWGFDVSNASTQALCLGNECTVTGANGTAVGAGSSATDGGIALGAGAAAAADEFVAGSVFEPATDVYFGHGKASEFSARVNLRASGGAGEDVAGGNLYLIGGRGTGAGAGGAIVLQRCPASSSGTTPNDCTGSWFMNSDDGSLIPYPSTRGIGSPDAPVQELWNADHYGDGKVVDTPEGWLLFGSTGTHPAPTHRVLVIGTDDNRTLVGTPTIAAGVNGQVVEIVQGSGSFCTTFQDDDELTGSLLRLSDSTVTLCNADVLTLRYLTGVGGGRWVQVSLSDNSP